MCCISSKCFCPHSQSNSSSLLLWQFVAVVSTLIAVFGEEFTGLPCLRESLFCGFRSVLLVQSLSQVKGLSDDTVPHCFQKKATKNKEAPGAHGRGEGRERERRGGEREREEEREKEKEEERRKTEKRLGRERGEEREREREGEGRGEEKEEERLGRERGGGERKRERELENAVQLIHVIVIA